MNKLNQLNKSFQLHRLFSSSIKTPVKHQINLTLRSIGAVVISGAGLFAYYQYQKHLASQIKQKTTASTGKPNIGGSFELVDTQGIPTTQKQFLGSPFLIYFGYTFCPDVCPEELEKMSLVVNLLDKENIKIKPIFVSVDPKRDSLKQIREYLDEFHPDFVGLTGTHEQIKRVAKAYRMYYSAPMQTLDDDDVDYLVDHSIFFFLMGSDGEYLAHFGKIDTAEEVVQKIKREISEPNQ